MQFRVHHDTDHMTSPVYSYPGDEQIDSAQYRKTIFNGYISSVSTVYGAARGYGLDIDADTFERWKRLCSAAGVIDDFLDASADMQDAHDLYEQELSAVEQGHEDIETNAWKPEDAEAAIILLRNSLATLPPERVSRLFAGAHMIGSIALMKAGADELVQYRELIRQEARYFGSLLSDSVSDYVVSQVRYRRFAQWCMNAIELGALVDHSWDLSSDYRRGRTSLRPRLAHTLGIASAALRPAGAMIVPPLNGLATLNGLRMRVQYSLTPTLFLVPRSRPSPIIFQGD